MKNVNSEEFDKEVLKADGTVLVDFWASWCGPCRMEIPYLQTVYDAYRERGLEIYAVSLDSDRDAWLSSIAATGSKWVQVCDLKAFDSPAALDYAVESIPSNVLIRCSDGQIVATQLRGSELVARLDELFDR